MRCSVDFLPSTPRIPSQSPHFRVERRLTFDSSEMYQKILTDVLKFPDEISPDARTLLSGLLTRDPALRLGVNGANEIKKHPFFASIDWNKLMAKKIQPPFKPSVESAVDTSNVSPSSLHFDHFRN